MRVDNSVSLGVVGLALLTGLVLLALFVVLPAGMALPLAIVALVGLVYFGLAILLSRLHYQVPDWLATAPSLLVLAVPVVLGVGLLFLFWAEVTVSSALFLVAMLFVFLYFWLVVPFALLQKNEQLSWERTAEVEEWPGVSLLVPAFKERGHLSTTLDSIARLTYPGEVELIVIDDGSLDGTYEEARDHDGTDPIVITKDNGGKHSALNAGLEEVSHDVVVSIDADSWLAPDALEQLVEGFERHPEAGAIAGNVKVGNRGTFLTYLQALEYVVGINTFRRAFDHVGLVNVVPGCLGAFRTEVLEEVEGYSPDTLTEDFDLTIEILRHGYPVHASDAVVYTYAPTRWLGLYRQRLRWFRGNIQTLRKHRDVMFRGRHGLLQKVVFPYAFLSMSLIPLLGIAVVAVIPFAIAAGEGAVIFQLAAFFLVLFGLLSLLAIEIDGEDRRLALLSPFSVVGYKQFLDVTLLQAAVDVLTGREMGWTSAGRIEAPDLEDLVYDPSVAGPRFQLYPTDAGWRWRLRSRNGRTLATCGRAYGSKEKAERTVDVLRKEARRPDPLPFLSSVGDTGDPRREFVVERDGAGAWVWRLRDRDGSATARDDRGFATRSRAERALRTARRRAAEAAVVVETRDLQTGGSAVDPDVDVEATPDADAGGTPGGAVADSRPPGSEDPTP